MGAILGYDALTRGTMMPSHQYLSPTSSNCTFYDAPLSPPTSSSPPGSNPTPNSTSPTPITPSQLSPQLPTHKSPSSSAVEMLRSTEPQELTRKGTSMSASNLQGVQEAAAKHTAGGLSHERVKRFSNPTYFPREALVSCGSDTGVDGRRISLCSQVSMTSDMMLSKMDFEVSHFFMFGSPLSMVLAYRRSLQDFRPGKPSSRVCNSKPYHDLPCTVPFLTEMVSKMYAII